MTFTTGPFTLTAGQTTNVPFPTNAPVGAVVLSNISPFLLKVNVPTGTEWLGPWSENIYVTPSGHQQLAVNPQLVPNSGGSGNVPTQLQATWYIPDEIPKGTWPVSLTAQAIAAAISGSVGVTGNVSTFGAQEHLTNSPFSFTGSPETKNFPLPVGGPSLDGLMLIPYASNPGQTTGNIKVVGHNTGITYLSTAASQAPFVCDFSSSADPSGVDVTFSLIGGAGNSFKLGVIGLNRSQLVRPVHGALAEGPTTIVTVGNGSTLFQVPNNGQYRIWSASIFGTGGAGQVSILVGTPTLLACQSTSQNSLSIEGGLPLTGLVSATVNANGTATGIGTVLYSIDA